MRKVIRSGRRPSAEALLLVEEARQAVLRALAVPPYLIVLYGSEARGEATPESDVDLLVVLEQDDQQTVDLIRDAVYEIMWNHDFCRLISVCTMSRSEFRREGREGYSFVKNVERDGIVLWQAA